MSNSKSYCSLSYHNMDLDKVTAFASAVEKGYFENDPPFNVLPFSRVYFHGKINDYTITRADYQNGGKAQKGAFLIAHSALMDALDSLAKEVNAIAEGDPEIIMLGGFKPTRTGQRDKFKPGQCTVTAKNGIAGELIPSCKKVEGAKHYGCIITEGAPLPEWMYLSGDGKLIFELERLSSVPGLKSIRQDLSMSRVKHFRNLKHDVTYYVYFYAVNATGCGPLSDAVSIVCW